jgi:hypothetical protein
VNNLIFELKGYFDAGRIDYIDRVTILGIITKHLGSEGLLYNLEFLIEEGVVAEISFGHGTHIYVDGRERIDFRKHNASMGA